MKIERIDDNSIRCTLTSLDLSSRNINLRDMTYGSEAAKRLFTEMMQKAQTEVGFTADNGPLMIEAVPLQGGSIQLVISKVEDPEELDTRFSKFSQNAGLGQNNWVSQLASEMLEGAQDIINILSDKDGSASGANAEDAEKKAPVVPKQDMIRIFRFDDLDHVADAAQAVGTLYKGTNALYKDEKTKKFYLVLHSGKGGAEILSRVTNVLSEYGQKIKESELMEAYFKEHYTIMIKRAALKKLATI